MAVLSFAQMKKLGASHHSLATDTNQKRISYIVNGAVALLSELSYISPCQQSVSVMMCDRVKLCIEYTKLKGKITSFRERLVFPLVS